MWNFPFECNSYSIRVLLKEYCCFGCGFENNPFFDYVDYIFVCSGQIEELESQLSGYHEEATNVTIMSTSDDTNSNPVNSLSNHVETIMTVSKQSHIDELEKLKSEFLPRLRWHICDKF